MTGCFLKKHLSFSLKSEFKPFVLGSCSSWWEISKHVILQKWTDAITTRTFTFLSSEANQVSVLRKQCCLQDGSQTPTQGVNDDYWQGCGGPALTSNIPAGSCINKVNYGRKVVCSYVGGMLGGVTCLQMSSMQNKTLIRGQRAWRRAAHLPINHRGFNHTCLAVSPPPVPGEIVSPARLSLSLSLFLCSSLSHLCSII